MSAAGSSHFIGATLLCIAGLVCGSFAIGASEFVVMGLLPQIAADLLPALFASDPESALALAGGTASGYALGVVAGVFVAPALLRKVSERMALLLSAVAMLVLTVCTSVAPTIETAIALRFLSALTHASYVGLASVMTARMLGSNRQGSGAALVMGGFALANVIGVPLLTMLGGGSGWRGALLICAALFACPLIALAAAPRVVRSDRPSSPSAIPAEGRRAGSARGIGRLVLAVTTIASGCFVAITYVAPIIDHAQQGQGQGPLGTAGAMLVFGIGMNLGNLLGGRLADRDANRALLLSGGIGSAGAVLLLLPGAAVGAGAGMLLMGIALGGASPSAQVLYVSTPSRFPRLSLSLAPATINLGSFIGASAGGAVLAGIGPEAVAWAALTLLALGSADRLLRMRGSRGEAGPFASS